nr:hypothetical protein CFP56_38117 [Quercus suber]
MDVGEGVEANLHVGRNGGRNQNIKRGDEIAELRRQVASHTEVVQRMQPPHEATDESDDSHSHFENPFGVPPRGRPFVERNEPRLDYNFKPSIQDVLSLQSFWNVSDDYNWALLVEKQQTRPALRSGQWGSRSG